MTLAVPSLRDDQRELVLRFFVFFSRFEYALKAAGWVRGDQQQAAEPNWNRVIEALNKAEETERASVLQIGGLLLTAPPRKQILVDGHLKWRDVKPSKNDPKKLVESVKRVRNNLFHGGKYSEGQLYLTDRAVGLIKSALKVLDRLLQVGKFREVRERFDQYTPEEG